MASTSLCSKDSCWCPGALRLLVVKRPVAFLLDDRASDQQPLDLASAFVDGEDLGVAVVLLDRMVVDVSPSAECLDCSLACVDGDLRGDELRHRALGLREGDLVGGHPRRAPSE